MSNWMIFILGVFVSILCLAFLVVSYMEVKRLGIEAENRDPSDDEIKRLVVSK
ncbi:MAG: hypothetical protein HKN33_02755 [Pyrinomonadaceae bacterium]|nr:hypothetical protein [Pyrinomonadaceae bacterium]